MDQTGTFSYGILNDKGELCRDFTISERAFRHTLELANDHTIDKSLLSDPAYYDAAIISKRLKVVGIDKLTVDQVLDMDGADGDTLGYAMVELDDRRSEFRSAQQATPEATPGTD